MRRILREPQQTNARKLDSAKATEPMRRDNAKQISNCQYLNRSACNLAIDCRMSGSSNDPSEAHASTTGQLFTNNRRGHTDVHNPFRHMLGNGEMIWAPKRK